MEPDHTIKDDTVQTRETSESETISELNATEEFSLLLDQNETLPEESDNGFVDPTLEQPTETETPDIAEAMDQVSGSNNAAGMFTTTAGAVGVVAVVTLLNLGASDAQIIKVKSFEDTVFYHVNVDPSTPIEPGSLQLRLTSTDDEYLVDLNFGETYGFVPRVTPETFFTVSLLGRNFLGSTTLGQVETITSPAPNAVLYFPELLNSLADDVLDYQMRAYMEDPLNLATALILKTGYYNPYTEDTTWFEDIPFHSGMTRYTIRGVPHRNAQVISQLWSTVMLEEPVEAMLDETRFFTPLYHEADAFIAAVTNQSARVILTPDFTWLPEATYTVRLLDVDRQVQVNQYSEGEGPITIEYTRLYTNTRYGVEVVVSFLVPGRGQRAEFTLYQEEFITPDRLNTVTAVVDNPNSSFVTITANGNIAEYTHLYFEIDGERTLVPLTRRTVDTALVTLTFDHKDTPYIVTFGLTNDAKDPEYIIGSERIERTARS